MNPLLRMSPTALVLALMTACTTTPPETHGLPAPRGGFALAIHGGAGTILPENMTPALEAEYTAALAEALRAGQAILSRGGTSLDAVEAAVRIMEDSPLFNAGRGAVFTAEGTNELDASIMDGRTLAAGAVAGVTTIRNPISLARLVMERSPHVMMAREGAEAFARQHGVQTVEPGYFHTPRRWEQLERAREAERQASRQGEEQAVILLDEDATPHATDDRKLGTVGAVAVDQAGNLAAATSTGGMTNKRFGRIGDSPVIGAGTYADQHCAVSSTGHGEHFIRNVVAYDICARVRYTGVGLEAAASEVVHRRLVEQGAEGGVIAIDRAGTIAMPFNSPGMYRGYVRGDGQPVVRIFRD
jgi:L-asparaginase / beta-aspartyl-peptidase